MHSYGRPRVAALAFDQAASTHSGTSHASSRVDTWVDPYVQADSHSYGRTRVSALRLA